MTPVLKKLLAIYEEEKTRAKFEGDRGFVTRFEQKSGCERGIMWRWKTNRSSGRIETVEAVANTLGYRLVLEKIADSK